LFLKTLLSEPTIKLPAANCRLPAKSSGELNHWEIKEPKKCTGKRY
jgi:hypothetical protein